MEIREEKILRYLENHKEEITEDLLCLVRAQSPSHHKPACDLSLIHISEPTRPY